MFMKNECVSAERSACSPVAQAGTTNAHLFPETPQESSCRKEDSMRNRLLATTAAMLVGMTFAAAQNMPNAQSERGPAGADRQQQGREMQRGSQDSGSAAQEKRGQS